MRFSIATLSTTALVAIAFCPAPASAVPIYQSGHADIGVAYEEGELHPHWHFGSNAKAEGSDIITDQEFDPEDAATRAPDSLKVTLPASGFEFTGAPGGSQIWVLPQNSSPNVPFLGLATEELESDDWLSPIQIALTSVVQAPANGYFSLWQSTFLGTQLKFDTFDGLGSDDQFDFPVGSHDHFNYGFTQPGVYKLELTFSGTHATDGFQSASGVFMFLVGDTTIVPEPSTWMLAACGLALFGAGCIRRRVAS